MQVRFSRLLLLGVGAAVLTSAPAALAQSSDNNAIPMALTGVFILMCDRLWAGLLYLHVFGSANHRR
jgi:hypothetical protein